MSLINKLIALDAGSIIQNIKDGMQSGESAGYDVEMQKSAMSTIGVIASRFFGILVVVIIVLVPLIVALEVCYIQFPLFRGGVNKLTDEHGRLDSILGFTFRDAQKAVKEHAVNGTASAMAYYIKLKLKSVYLVMFIVALLLAGNAFVLRVLIKILSPLIVGIVDILKKTS